MSEITFNPDDFTLEAMRKRRAWLIEESEMGNIAAQSFILSWGAVYEFRTTSFPRIVVRWAIADDIIDDSETFETLVPWLMERAVRVARGCIERKE